MFRPVQLGYPGAMPKQLTTVFFDFTNTLVRLRGSVGEIYADVAQRHGLDAPPAEIDVHFNAALESVPQPVEPGLSADAMAARERQWWRELAARSMRPFGDFPCFEPFFDEVFELYRSADPWELLPHARECLEELRDQGRTLGVISDMDARLHDVFDILNLTPYFEIICLSFRTGYAKPSLQLYEAGIHKAATTASHCAHVGDSLTKDVEPALATRMTAIHLDETNADNTPPQAHKINSLSQLPTLLQSLEAPN